MLRTLRLGPLDLISNKTSAGLLLWSGDSGGEALFLLRFGASRPRRRLRAGRAVVGRCRWRSLVPAALRTSGPGRNVFVLGGLWSGDAGGEALFLLRFGPRAPRGRLRAGRAAVGRCRWRSLVPAALRTSAPQGRLRAGRAAVGRCRWRSLVPAALRTSAPQGRLRAGRAAVGRCRWRSLVPAALRGSRPRARLGAGRVVVGRCRWRSLVLVAPRTSRRQARLRAGLVVVEKPSWLWLKYLRLNDSPLMTHNAARNLIATPRSQSCQSPGRALRPLRRGIIMLCCFLESNNSKTLNGT